MKKITLAKIAEYLEVSITTVWGVRHGTKRFSSRRARDIAEKTGIPLEQLLFADGEKIFQSLSVAYTLQRPTQEES